MAYINPPEPHDSEVIVPAIGDQPAFTWADHRQMLGWLEELDGPATEEARRRLDENLKKYGWLDDEGKKLQICQWCAQTIDKPHESDCPDYRTDNPEEWGGRYRGAYQYYDENFELLHLTSAPMTDEEAIAYVGDVANWFPDHTPTYVWARELQQDKFVMLPWSIDPETLEVTVTVRG